MKMVRVLAFAVASCLLIAVLSGCGIPGTSGEMADMRSFYSMDAFLEAQEPGVNKFARLKNREFFYLPTQIPEEYALYQIRVEDDNIWFWFFPLDAASRSGGAEGIKNREECFVFISPRKDSDKIGDKRVNYQTEEGYFTNYHEEYVAGMSGRTHEIWRQGEDCLILYFPEDYPVEATAVFAEAVRFARDKNKQFVSEDGLPPSQYVKEGSFDFSEKKNEEDYVLYVTPVVYEYFTSFEEFMEAANEVNTEEYDPAQLDTLESFYTLSAVPEDYVLYKIVAGRENVVFYYLPEFYAETKEKQGYGENALKQLQLEVTRYGGDFASIMRQNGATEENIVDGKYLILEWVRDTVVWEHDGQIVSLIVPYQMEPADLMPYCVLDKYVRNEENRCFALADD